MMDKFFIISNTEKDQTLETAQSIIQYLKKRGKYCQIYQSDGDLSEYYRYTDLRKVPKDTECILVLGGDGTIIQASRDLLNLQIPMVGINLGTLGYLAEVGRQSIEPLLEKLIDNEYYVEDRMMIRGELERDGAIIHHDVALNDIVLGRGGPLGIIQFDLYVNGEYLSHYKADGMIIATPTGSTAYSLSAGGPILAPNGSMFVLTPICTHSLNSRSIVLPDDSVIELIYRGENKRRSMAVVSYDADTSCWIKNGDTIRITCSEKKAKLIRISKVSFLETLRKKMASQ